MKRKRWRASVNHCVMSQPQKTWRSLSSHLYICFLRMSLHQLITRPVAASSRGSSSSCWAFLPSTCTLALFQAGGKSGQLSQASYPNATSSQRQREDISSSVSFSGVRRSRLAYWPELDHTAVVSVRVQVDN